MSGLNPFRHKKAASTVGTVAAGDSSFPTLEPGSRRHRPEPQAWDSEDRRPATAEEWLRGIDTAAVTQREDQREDGGRQLFERAMMVDEYPSRPTANSKTVRIASPPAKQIPYSDEDNDGREGIPDATAFEYMATNSTVQHTSTHRVSTLGLNAVEDPFNAAIGSSGSSDDDDEEDDSTSDVDGTGRLTTRSQEGLGLGLGPAADLPALRRVSYQEGLRQGREHDQMEAAKRKRATMDVDTFKRLLLTGDTGTEDTNASRDLDIRSPSNQHPLNIGTAVTMQENHGDQPRSAASSISSQQRSDKRPPKLPPPPPKTRRGKVIARSAEPTDSTMRPAGAPVSPQTSTHTTSYTKSPASSIHGVPPASPISRRTAVQSEPSPSSMQHKRPPTPPLTRRHSQMKRGNASISRIDSTKLSLPLSATKPLNRSASLNSASNPKTPPPPPSRRAGTGTSVDHGSVTSSTPDTSSLDTPMLSMQHNKDETDDHSQRHSHSTNNIYNHNYTPASTSASSTSSKPLPPPPRRTIGPSNTAHSTDINLTRRPPSISTEADDHPLPPPPPPLRKSSRGSNIAEAGTSAPSNANGILADLSQLQQELDKFRELYEGAEGGPGGNIGK
ncbi:uncharacterized protein GIQ15_06828 [Arthroderma uncinatum]|uniref:uncharacterized protein n=1 Tax=Arthroderma uncinatum TaxID=74035 RepID=UPI00144A92AD|nr:uncharacterized protein GIQ15_06828 [Arthroderma uncinatum]KAF3479852.1 hypothetical protein GIQ15_06828 [Arthroderma uncinatum]